MRLGEFPEEWVIDFEYTQLPGECPRPVCFVGYEIRSGRWLRYFMDEMPAAAPFARDALIVSYSTTAEFSCFLPLHWELPKYAIDLFAQYRLHVNTIGNKSSTSLLSALDHFRISHITTEQKEKMQQLAMRGAPFSGEERRALLEYCETDVKPLPELLEKLVGGLSSVQFAQALERGRYTKAVARMEAVAVPLDVETHGELKLKWDNLLLALIAEVDRQYHVYDGTTFKFDRFEDWLNRQRIAWPKTPKGRLKSDDDTFKAMAVAYPILNPLRELRATLSTMKHWTISVGSDGRNRTSLKPFTTQTGRNAPSNTASIFGTARWLRSLIKPNPGDAVAYVDYEQEEFGIAAWLSRDKNMLAAYGAGDVYLAFAKQAGAIPQAGTKKTHGRVRDQYKQCVLAVGYGQQARSLSVRIGSTESQAQRLLDQHHETYKDFWDWSDRVLATVELENEFCTRAGWRIKRSEKLNGHEQRSIRNFPVQSTASDILHLCCSMATEAGIRVCLPVHDALLIEAPINEIDVQVKKARAVMAAASRTVLGGFAIRTDSNVFTDRFMDERGTSTWNLVMKLLKTCAPPPFQHSLFGPKPEEPRIPPCMHPPI